MMKTLTLSSLYLDSFGLGRIFCHGYAAVFVKKKRKKRIYQKKRRSGMPEINYVELLTCYCIFFSLGFLMSGTNERRQPTFKEQTNKRLLISS